LKAFPEDAFRAMWEDCFESASASEHLKDIEASFGLDRNAIRTAMEREAERRHPVPEMRLGRRAANAAPNDEHRLLDVIDRTTILAVALMALIPSLIVAPVLFAIVVGYSVVKLLAGIAATAVVFVGGGWSINRWIRPLVKNGDWADRPK